MDYREMHELYHHGVKGMSWGDRRYQNEDGSLTPLGRQHYGYGDARDPRAHEQKWREALGYKGGPNNKGKIIGDVRKYANQQKPDKQKEREDYLDKQIKKEKIKKGAKIAAAALVVVGGTALVSYYGGSKKGMAKGLELGRKQGYAAGKKAAYQAIQKLTKKASQNAYKEGFKAGGEKMKQQAQEHYKKKFKEYVAKQAFRG